MGTPNKIHIIGLLKRFIVQKVGFEKGNYKQTLEMLRKMYKWNYGHEKNEKPAILSILEQHHKKLLVLSDNTDVAIRTGSFTYGKG